MKKVCVFCVAVIVAAASFAQNTLVATLTHGNKISMYYGVNALIEAYDSACDNDIITLSGGRFNSPVFSKSITVRGTGVEAVIPTVIEDLHAEDIKSGKLFIEGIEISRLTKNNLLRKQLCQVALI